MKFIVITIACACLLELSIFCNQSVKAEEKQKAPQFPQVVSNGCGGWAVCMGKQEEDTSKYRFIGLYSHYSMFSHNLIIGGDGGYSIGLMRDAQSIADSMITIIWAGDTSYYSNKGAEIIFKDSASAVGAMNGYHAKMARQLFITDSVFKCHNYNIK